MNIKHFSCDDFTLKQAMEELKRISPEAVITEVDRRTITVLSTGQREAIWSLSYKEVKQNGN